MTSLARAHTLADLGRPAAARTELAGHLAEEPDSVDGLCLLARCELELGDYQESLRATGRALANAPDSDWALRLRALALGKARRYGDAKLAAEAAIVVDQNDWTNHYVLATVLANADDAEPAYEAAQRAVALAPHESEAHVILGVTASGLKRKAEARAAYHEALRLDPESSVALNNLAAIDINAARLGRAARTVTAGLRIDPGETTLQRNLDVVAMRLMVRLLRVMLVTGFLPLIIIAAQANHPWWARAVVGVVQLCVYTLVVWSTLRHLPPGARRHLRGLPRRMTGGQRCYGILLVVLTAALLVTAFMPGSLWVLGAGVVAVVLRLAQILFVVWIIRSVVGFFRAGDR